MCASLFLRALSLGLSWQCDSQFHSAAAAVWTGHHAFFIIVARERFQESLVTIEAHEFAVRHRSPPLRMKSGNTYATPGLHLELWPYWLAATAKPDATWLRRPPELPKGQTVRGRQGHKSPIRCRSRG